MSVTFGVILTFFGLISNASICSISLGININLKWGLVLIGFGGLMLLLSRRGARQHRLSQDGAVRR